MAALKLFPASDIDFEAIQDGQMVAMRFRSAEGDSTYATIPVDLLKKAHTHIPTVPGVAKEMRGKAGIADADSKVELPPLHDPARIEFGLLENEPVKVCLLFESNHAMTLATKANRAWIGNAIGFLQEKLVETGAK